MKFRVLIEDSITHNRPGYLKETAYKTKGLEFVDSLRVPRAKEYYRGRFDNIPYDDLPDTFVIHPTQGTSSRGVLLLEKDGDTFKERRRKLTGLTKADIKERFYSEQRGRTDCVWVEELLPDAHDIRCYAFRGKIPLFAQTFMKEPPYQCFDENLMRVDAFKKYGKRVPGTLRQWHRPNELIEYAVRISKALDYPFARIDMYDSPQGVYFGEVSAHPGEYLGLHDEWDRKLGCLWKPIPDSLR